MRSNGAKRQGGQRVAAGLAGGQNRAGLKAVPDPDSPADSPEQGIVVRMLHATVGSKLDALHQAAVVAKDAQQLRDLAKQTGDHASEDALTQALRRLEAASKTNDP